jgi:hypothetical protein
MAAPHSYHFVGIYNLGRSFAEELFNQFLDGGNTGGSSYQNNFINIGSLEACIG